MKYIKDFEKLLDYIIFRQSDDFIAPNISYVEDNESQQENKTISFNPLIKITPSVSISNWTYGETTSNPSISGNTGNGEVTYMYKLSTESDNTYTTNKPTNAGTYTVKAVIEGTNRYSAGTCTSSFTIYKANINPTVSISNWNEGDTPENPSVSGNLGNATVTYMYKVSTASDDTYTSTKPSTIGTYTVKAVIWTSDNYNGAICTSNFSIITHNYNNDYFTIESLEDNNTISWKASDSSLTKTISISTDDGTTWTEKTSDTTGVTLDTLNTGDKLLIKGSNTAYANGSYYNYFVSTKEFNVSGNIMSLIYGDNFIGQTTLNSTGHNFKSLFFNCTKLISAENIKLPATTLKTYCYYTMFYGCTSLTTAPMLPATILANQCYYEMFRGCTSLTTAPELPATTLASHCYKSMFSGCTSLTTAPELPATTLATYCYAYMFKDCTSLTTAPELPATTLTQYCYQYMFQNCTSLTTAPELPATTLAEKCYWNMFNGCTSLSSIKCLATDISANSCTNMWVNGIASTGTFIKNPNMSSWSTGVNGIPSGWTVQDAA